MGIKTAINATAINVILLYTTTVRTEVLCKKCCRLRLAKCCWTPSRITKMYLLTNHENFRGFAGRYGEHYCKFSLQTNMHKKVVASHATTIWT